MADRMVCPPYLSRDRDRKWPRTSIRRKTTLWMRVTPVAYNLEQSVMGQKMFLSIVCINFAVGVDSVWNNTFNACNYSWQVAQLLQRYSAAGWVSYGQKWKTVNGRHFMDIIGLSSTTMTSKAIDFGEKTQKGLLRRSRSFKVIKVGISWKPVCDFLLVINSNWHPISCRFGVIAAYCSNFLTFCIIQPTLWGLRDNVRCPSWAHWKARSGLPISVNWTFLARSYGLGATNENRSKIGDFAPMRSLWPKISGRRGRHRTIIFAWIVRPMNAIQLFRWQFSHKETL